jgi:Sec-independent protein translocase protein TatA
VSLILLALLLFLLFGGSRIGAAGKGLGQAARHVKRALADEEETRNAVPKTPPPAMIESSESKEPKLLPAKGESSASSGGES